MKKPRLENAGKVLGLAVRKLYVDASVAQKMLRTGNGAVKQAQRRLARGIKSYERGVKRFGAITEQWDKHWQDQQRRRA